MENSEFDQKSQIRVRNLMALIQKESQGNVAQFARRYNLDATYIRQLKNGDRVMGEKSAWNFENAIGLVRGALDIEWQTPMIDNPTQDLESAIQRAPYLSEEYKDFLINNIREIAKKTK